MKAVNDFVVIDKIKATEKKQSGLIMTEETDKDLRYYKAKVVSYGNLVEFLKEEDIVWYDKHAGHGIEYQDKFYFVIKARDIVLVD